MSAKSRQQGRFGELIMIPRLGSSGPGDDMPMPSTDATLDFIAASITRFTQSMAVCAEPLATMGTRVLERILPASFTTPAATLVPPISTPKTDLPIFRTYSPAASHERFLRKPLVL